MEKKKRNWRSRYLTLTEWDAWLKNDWKHLSWKVDITLTLLLIILAVALAKLFD